MVIVSETIMRPENSFHDPALKAAIRGLQGEHRAKPELREAIMSKLEEAREGETPRTLETGPDEDIPASAGMFTDGPPLRLPVHNPYRISRWLAVAAALLICVGG